MDSYIMLAFLGIFFFAFIFGKWADPIFRCKMLRQLTKKNYMVIAIVQKDGRTISQRVVNAEKDVAIVNNALWVILGGRVYRRDKTGSSKKKDILNAFEKGTKEEADFQIKADNIVFEEGVPTVYLDSDTITPLDFYRDKATIKPEEVGSALLAYVYNQLAKAMASVSNIRLLLLIILAGVLICAGLGYMIFTELTTMHEEDLAFHAEMRSAYLPTDGTITEGKLVIEQDRGGT